MIIRDEIVYRSLRLQVDFANGKRRLLSERHHHVLNFTRRQIKLNHGAAEGRLRWTSSLRGTCTLNSRRNVSSQQAKYSLHFAGGLVISSDLARSLRNSTSSYFTHWRLTTVAPVRRIASLGTILVMTSEWSKSLQTDSLSLTRWRHFV